MQVRKSAEQRRPNVTVELTLHLPLMYVDSIQLCRYGSTRYRNRALAFVYSAVSRNGMKLIANSSHICQCRIVSCRPPQLIQSPSCRVQSNPPILLFQSHWLGILHWALRKQPCSEAKALCVRNLEGVIFEFSPMMSTSSYICYWNLYPPNLLADAIMTPRG